MSNKMTVKIIFLVILSVLDIGFIPRFLGYNTANKITVIIFYLITIGIIWSIVRENKRIKLERKRYAETVQKTINSIRAGSIPKIEHCSLVLKKGEFACNEVQAYLSETKNKAVGSTSSGGGISVRIANGVYARSGSGGSRKIYKNVTEKFFGNFIITNQRIVFLNGQKGFEITHKDLTGLFSDEKSLIVQSKNKSYTICVNEPVLFEELIRAVIKKQPNN